MFFCLSGKTAIKKQKGGELSEKGEVLRRRVIFLSFPGERLTLSWREKRGRF